jgi:hypothetical protein
VNWDFGRWRVGCVCTLWVRDGLGGNGGRPRRGRRCRFKWRRALWFWEIAGHHNPLQLPGDWSALRHAGYAVGSRPEGDRRRDGPGRSCRRGPAPEGRRPGGTDWAAGRGVAEGGLVASAGPGDRAGVDGGRDRAGRHEHERYRGAGAPGPRAGGRAERPDGAAGPGPGRQAGHAGPDRPGPR